MTTTKLITVMRFQAAKKYAKWRATHINQCLKTGETPQPGNSMKDEEGVTQLFQFIIFRRLIFPSSGPTSPVHPFTARPDRAFFVLQQPGWNGQ